jgi:hypothetical protein
MPLTPRTQSMGVIGIYQQLCAPISYADRGKKGGTLVACLGVGVRDLRRYGWRNSENIYLSPEAKCRPQSPPSQAATKRRAAGIGGAVPRPEESLPRAPVAAVPPFHRSGLRRILGQGQMCPRPLVVVKIALQRSAQRSFIPHDDVAQTLAPDRSHQPF